MVLYETEESHSILYKVTRHLCVELVDVEKLPRSQPEFVNAFSGRDVSTTTNMDPVVCVLYTSGSTGGFTVFVPGDSHGRGQIQSNHCLL